MNELAPRARALPAMPVAKGIFTYRKYWAKRFGTAPFLPMSRAEMDALGWDSCDIIIVTGDAYVDHPSFGMALVGRLLEAQGFRVGIIAQPDWQRPEPFKALGRPNLFFGVTGGNMDSMVNRYTADRRIRSNDAYTPDAEGGKRPDRAVIVYSQRCREAYPDATDRDRRHRGVAAPHRPLRLLVRQGAPLACWPTPRPTCCSTATPSAPWSRSRTACAKGEPIADDRRHPRRGGA